MRRSTSVLFCLLISGLTTSLAHADIIAGQGGTVSTSVNFSPEGVSWTQTASYTNVSVTAELASVNSAGGGAATIYLTNSIGPGTTTANLIATASLSGVSGTPSDITVFTGLNLGPGTYYAILFNTPGTVGLLAEGNTTLDSLATPGNTTNLDVVWLSGSNAFPPADSFSNVSSDTFDAVYEVTGTLATTGTPEPSSLILLGTGLLGFAGMAKRRLS